MADLHLQVQKSQQNDRTVTEVTTLDHASHLQAIAGLISGKEISPSSLNHAAELVAAAQSV